MMQQYAPAPTLAPPAVDPVASGFDPALLQALAENNPLAATATAGLFDNSLMLALTGQEPRSDAAEPRSPLFPEGSYGDREADQAPDWANDESEAQEGFEAQLADGSGQHGQFDPTAVDHANYAFWRGVAAAAEAGGLVNAARHMNHFLDNSGSPLQLEPEHVIRDAPVATEELEYHQGVVSDQALMGLDGADTTQGGGWPVSSPLLSEDRFYFGKSESEDWYFAVGGHSAGFNGYFTYLPDADGSGSGTMRFEGTYLIADQYNWDEGKSVTIAGVRVDDTVLGRLHQVGLACEFSIWGEMPMVFEMRYWGQRVTPNLPDVEPITGRDGGRTDPGRERA